MLRDEYCFETLEKKVAILHNTALQWSTTGKSFLISGASGSGKTALCHWLAHQISSQGKIWQEVNLAALDESVCDSELTRKFELARQGIVIVEDIGEMSLMMQAKLYEVAHRVEGAPVNLILTSRQSLSELEAQNRLHVLWREKLKENCLVLPTLNERVKDIAVLADFILEELVRTHDRELKFSPEVYHFLCLREWEGNILELKNWITRLYFLNEHDLITALDLPSEEPQSVSGPWPIEFNRLYPMSLQELEKQYILHSVAMNKGNKSQTARTLQISLKTLRTKLKEYESILI